MDFLKYLYKKWIIFGEKLGHINSTILLFILYFLVVLPLGLLMKIFKGDFLNLKLVNEDSSYRIRRDKIYSAEDFERPF